MLGWAMRTALTWGVLFFLAYLTIEHPGALDKLVADVVRLAEPPVPPAPESGNGGRSVVIRADSRGHFLVTAEVQGTPIRFLVDSGATSVVLSRKDAEKAGIRPRSHQFTQLYQTAGGLVRAAPVRLSELRIGALTMRDVPASVSESQMTLSLLGTSFLNRLDGYEVQGGRMTLRW